MSKVYDAYENEVVLNENSFVLTQQDVKIHDAKFETKTTTFLKDAFKRFCKNKSSIVGAFIIGILILLSILVPWLSPYDVKTEDSAAAKLRPRLFGSGFWSGEETKTNVTYDLATETPVGHVKSAVVEILDMRTEIISSTSDYAFGGTYAVMTEAKKTDIYFYSYAMFNATSTGDYKLSIQLDDLDDENGTFRNKYTHGQYRILLTYNNSLESGEVVNYIQLQDWTSEIKQYEFNISSIIEEMGLESLKNCRVRFEIKADPELVNLYYLGVNDVTITCSEEEGLKEARSTDGKTVITQAQLLSDISLTDANAVIKMQKNPKTGKFDNAYWKCNGLKAVERLEITVVDFIYNKYYAVYGEAEKTVGKSVIQNYIDAGYMKYDFEAGISSFEILDEKRCPVTEVYEQLDNTTVGTTYLRCKVVQYKEKGYTSMPKYIFGTDAHGFDLFTKCFTNLLRSLVLAVVTSAICFAFGLVWGAVSGYFGGTVDLMMERFMEILGGVPWVVVMTLVLLILKDTEIIVRLGVAICLTGWMGTAGVTRTQFYRFKGREYILASRTLGANDMRLIFRHILPNSMGTIITSSVLKIPTCIFTESSLAYLGLLKGTNSFGTILSGNQQYISTYPVLILFPAFIISLLMISFNLFGNGLRDAFNPSLKGSE